VREACAEVVRHHNGSLAVESAADEEACCGCLLAEGRAGLPAPGRICEVQELGDPMHPCMYTAWRQSSWEYEWETEAVAEADMSSPVAARCCVETVNRYSRAS
jgi:hypothetical protein